MADIDAMTPGQILADSSVAEFIKELGLGIAAAQTALDDNSVRQMEAFTTRRDDLGGRTLLDLGLSPAFYHYQHADISCAMQIRMEVGTSDEFGFGITAGVNDQNDSSESATDSSSSSASGQRTTKTAKLEMTSDSPAVLTLQGGSDMPPTDITPTGNTPTEKLADLQTKLAKTNGAVDRLVFSPPTTPPSMALSSPSNKVVVQSPTVAFLKPADNAALIRIADNTDTDFKVSSNLTVATTAKPDLNEYTEHVRDQFTNAGFTTTLLKPGSRVEIGSSSHDTGLQEPQAASVAALEQLALLLKQVPAQKIEIEGYTDRQGPAAANVALGEARAKTVRDIIVSHGVPAAQVAVATPASRGEQAAIDAGDTDGKDNQYWRTTKLYLSGLPDHWILARNGPSIDLTQLEPDGTTGTGSPPPNAFVAVVEPEALSLSGNGLIVDSVSFPFKGTAAGGSAAGSGEAYARNLTADINNSATHRAWSVGNVVWVATVASKFALQLFSSAPGTVAVASEGMTISEQFHESSSSVASQDRDRKRTVAVGVSVSARFSRQFNMAVTGNSAISARLVSVPAPPEFLDQIAAYQNSLNP